MSDRISERMLERARLGELTEEESVRLIGRLEAEEGSTERLDELIAADAEFLERHPSDEMSAMIRARLERRARDRQRESDKKGARMLNLGPVTRPALGLAFVALIVACGVYFASQVPDPPANEAVAERTEPAETEPVPSEVAAARPVIADKVEVMVGESTSVPATGLQRIELDDPNLLESRPNEAGTEIVLTGREAGETEMRLVTSKGERRIQIVVVPNGEEIDFAERLGVNMTDTREVILEPGDELTFDISGLKRIAIDVTRVAQQPQIDEQTNVGTITAKEPGLTGVRIFFDSGQPPFAFYVRVARAINDSDRLAGGPLFEASAAAVEKCDRLAREAGVDADANIRVLVAPSGDVTSAYLAVSAIEREALIDCVLELAYTARFAKAADRQYRTTLLSLEIPSTDGAGTLAGETAAATDDDYDADRKAALKHTIKGEYRKAIQRCERHAEHQVACARVLAVSHKNLGNTPEACRWFGVAGIDGGLDCD